MGYSKSPETLRAIQVQLQPIAEGKPCAWDTPDNQADKWAYKVREGLSIAMRHPRDFPDLAKFAPYFVIEVLSHNKVQAKLAEFTPEQVVLASGSNAGIITGGGDAGSTRTFNGPQTAMTVINSWLESQSRFGHNDRLHFPGAALTDAELTKLYNWALKRTPPWMLLKPQGSDSLTLMPWDDQAAAAGANWKPSNATQRTGSSASEGDSQPADSLPSLTDTEGRPVPPGPGPEERGGESEGERSSG